MKIDPSKLNDKELEIFLAGRDNGLYSARQLFLENMKNTMVMIQLTAKDSEKFKLV
jgi:hypothetical protein